MSSYSAEYAKGPMIFEAFSKSGGNKFHGEGYLYARNSALNSDDAYAHSQGIPNSAEHYYYMGGNIGGPILHACYRLQQEPQQAASSGLVMNT